MTRSFQRTALTLALAAFTGAAFAQSQPSPASPSSPSAQPPAAAPSTPPGAMSPSTTTSPASPAATAPTGSTMKMPSRTEPADSAYRTLDAGKRGYLQKSDVQGIEGFSFDTADTNKDGRLSQEEFNKAWSTKTTK